MIAEALNHDHLSKEAVIPADLRRSAYRAVASYDNDGLVLIYIILDLHEVKLRAAQGMSFKDKNCIGAQRLGSHRA